MPTPPIASTRPVTTTLHGVERTDPYAWIADPDEPEVAAYLDVERAYYDARVAPLAGLRAELRRPRWSPACPTSSPRRPGRAAAGATAG